MIFILLFLLIVGVSIYLAFLSMKDFYELPPKDTSYGLFLIKNPPALETGILDQIGSLLTDSLIVSFEKLYKGSKLALVIFGPKKILVLLKDLDLVELEDYTKVSQKKISAWELKEPYIGKPKLGMEDQLWLQYCLGGKPLKFKVTMRAITVSSHPKILPNSLKIYRDFKKRLFAPLSKNTQEFSAEELLAKLLPQ